MTVEIMDSLASAFPEQGDVWAKNVNITADGQVSLTAFAKTRAAELAFNDRLIAHPGISGVELGEDRGTNPIQFTVNFTYNPRQ